MSDGVIVDFSELELLCKQVSDAAHGKGWSPFKPDKVLKAGAYEMMKNLVKDTPVGENGSNWYTSYYPNYTLGPRQHTAGTLAKGWVQDTLPDRKPKGRPKSNEVKDKVDRTAVIRSGAVKYQMNFVNSAPYSTAVEVGHLVRLPNMDIVGYVPGKWFTRRSLAVHKADVLKAMQKECTKQLKEVFTI